MPSRQQQARMMCRGPLRVPGYCSPVCSHVQGGQTARNALEQGRHMTMKRSKRTNAHMRAVTVHTIIL
jgi:hypothetical protein